MIVTFEIAKLAKEKGFEKESPNYYLESGELLYDNNYNNSLQETKRMPYFNAPTYYQLINWVFNSLGDLSEISKGSLAYPILFNKNVEWLEYWYKQLKDCPLQYEFKGRLLEWFRKNDYFLNIYDKDNLDDYIYSINSDTTYNGDWETYGEAKHQGILEIFKLIKNENNK